jgi:hypothetical protein
MLQEDGHLVLVGVLLSGESSCTGRMLESFEDFSSEGPCAGTESTSGAAALSDFSTSKELGEGVESTSGTVVQSNFPVSEPSTGRYSTSRAAVLPDFAFEKEAGRKEQRQGAGGRREKEEGRGFPLFLFLFFLWL